MGFCCAHTHGIADPHPAPCTPPPTAPCTPPSTAPCTPGPTALAPPRPLHPPSHRPLHPRPTPQTLCPTLPAGAKVVVNCSGRGDKDVNTAAKFLPEMSGGAAE